LGLIGSHVRVADVNVLTPLEVMVGSLGVECSGTTYGNKGFWVVVSSNRSARGDMYLIVKLWNGQESSFCLYGREEVFP
jgi:hypothetical protein